MGCSPTVTLKCGTKSKTDMNTKRILSTVIVIASLVSASAAESELFKAHEFTLDLSANYTAAEPNGFSQVLKTDARHGKWGINGGATYFITRNFGVGFEAGSVDLESHSNRGIDYTTLTIVGRLPLGHVAPYAVAGIGRDFDEGSYNTQAGAGVEFRFTRHFGVFMDGRFIFQEDQKNDALFCRSGVRFAF